ncbi:MAG TPA: hypothetical protein VMT96_00435 [Candidatus Bathyarchaeia archaeon]|nr:hypothetical protein [Candidatus Bathyarchaeia archaeon]
MTKLLSKKATEFEQVFNSIALSSWNRPRSTSELHAFIARREAVVETAEK